MHAIRLQLKCTLYEQKCAASSFLLLSGHLFSTPGNSNLFSISPEGSSYRDSTVYAFVTAEIKLELIKEKPKRHFISRQLLPRVSELSMRHMSTKSIESTIHLTFSRDFSCVTGLLPWLYFCTSETRLKSSPHTHSSHSK